MMRSLDPPFCVPAGSGSSSFLEPQRETMLTGDVVSVSLRCYARGDCTKKEAKEEMLQE